MMHTMKKILLAILAIASVAYATSASALTLRCVNVAHVPIAVAVSYLDLDGKTWLVEGWYTLEPGVKANIELESSNDIFYIYGEFAGGAEVSGGSGSLNLPVYYKTFKYVQGQQLVQADNVVSFVRGVAGNGVADISFGPINQ